MTTTPGGAAEDRVLRARSAPGLLLLVAAMALGLAFTYAAAQTWRGVHQSLTADRVAGTVTGLDCGRDSGGARSCHGSFDADDGSLTDMRVRIEGGANDGDSGEFVAGIDTGLIVGGVQSVDSFYVDGVSGQVNTVGPVALGVLLSVLALVFDVLALLMLWAVLRGRSGLRPEPR